MSVIRINILKKDFLGITASALCAVHCLATPFVIALIPTTYADVWKSPMAHYIFAAAVTFFCVMAAVTGYRAHKSYKIIILMTAALALILTATFMPCGDECCDSKEQPLLILGSLLMIAGHVFNYRQCCNACKLESIEALE